MHLSDLKPAAPARLHLFLAALMWTVVGGLLFFFGVRWTLQGGHSAAPWILVAAAATGLSKSVLLIDRAADRISRRIVARGDGRCIGGFLSIRSWALVAAMAGGGRLLRTSALSPQVAGFLYSAVGVALPFSSRRLWRAWRKRALEQ
jgi:hypothetical protein